MTCHRGHAVPLCEREIIPAVRGLGSRSPGERRIVGGRAILATDRASVLRWARNPAKSSRLTKSATLPLRGGATQAAQAGALPVRRGQKRFAARAVIAGRVASSCVGEGPASGVPKGTRDTVTDKLREWLAACGRSSPAAARHLRRSQRTGETLLLPMMEITSTASAPDCGPCKMVDQLPQRLRARWPVKPRPLLRPASPGRPE